MKVVIDEGVPRLLAKLLSEVGIEANRFPLEWRNLSNGKLIDVAEKAGFGCLLTNDRNMANQTSLIGRNISVVALPSNKVSVIRDRAADIANTIRQSAPGQHIVMDMDGSRSVRQSGRDGVAQVQLQPVSPFKPA